MRWGTRWDPEWSNKISQRRPWQSTREQGWQQPLKLAGRLGSHGSAALASGRGLGQGTQHTTRDPGKCGRKLQVWPHPNRSAQIGDRLGKRGWWSSGGSRLKTEEQFTRRGLRRGWVKKWCSQEGNSKYSRPGGCASKSCAFASLLVFCRRRHVSDTAAL